MATLPSHRLVLFITAVLNASWDVINGKWKHQLIPLKLLWQRHYIRPFGFVLSYLCHRIAHHELLFSIYMAIGVTSKLIVFRVVLLCHVVEYGKVQQNVFAPWNGNDVSSCQPQTLTKNLNYKVGLYHKMRSGRF